MARPGIEPRTSGLNLRVRCPTDCATRPGHIFQDFSNIKQDINTSVCLANYNTLNINYNIISKIILNPIALRKAKIAYNFDLSKCNRDKVSGYTSLVFWNFFTKENNFCVSLL